MLQFIFIKDSFLWMTILMYSNYMQKMNITEQISVKKCPFWPESWRSVLHLQNYIYPSSLNWYLNKMKFCMLINHTFIVILEKEY